MRSRLVWPLLLALGEVSAKVPLSLVFTRQEALQGAVLFGAGDVVAQALEHHVDGRSLVSEAAKGSLVDPSRLVKAAGIGSIHGGLFLPFVYQLAEALFPGRSPKTVLLKTCISCGLLSTGGNYYSLVVRRLLAPSPLGENFEKRVMRCLDSVHDIFADVILDDLKVWPLYDVLCFALVPPHLRPLSTAAVSVCWHTYISFRASRSGECAH